MIAVWLVWGLASKSDCEEARVLLFVPAPMPVAVVSVVPDLVDSGGWIPVTAPVPAPASAATVVVVVVLLIDEPLRLAAEPVGASSLMHAITSVALPLATLASAMAGDSTLPTALSTMATNVTLGAPL